MIYDYKNIPWHAFIRQEDINRMARLEELKKKEKKEQMVKQGLCPNDTTKENKLTEETKGINLMEINLSQLNLEPVEINLDD